MSYFQTHSEAVRLDDYDELAKHKGNESDVFQWLTHQAWHGLSDAQVGDRQIIVKPGPAYSHRFHQ